MHNRRLPCLLAVVLVVSCAAVSSAPDPLADSDWVLRELPGRTLVPGSSVTLAFAEGRAAGTDGCNRYALPYTQAADRLDFDARGASTMMACPPQVMEQASAYSAGLARTRAFRRTGDSLELLADDGEILARFAAQPVGLASTAWRVTGYNNGRQAVTSVRTGSTLTLAFAADGTVSGSAGCNNYRGSWEARGDSLRIGPAATTRRLCVDGEVMAQEQAFLTALGTVATARREADQLELRTAAGALAVQAVRDQAP
jgi:heat shock protein HslJ